MRMFTLVKSEVKPLTKDLAEKFRDLKASPTEREINPARMKYLERMAADDKLVTFHWSTAEISGETVRMNGQHSSAMLAGLNGAFPDGLYVHLDHYKVDGPEGLAALFRQFDARKSSRSASDVAGAYQGLVPELQGLNKRLAKLGIEAVVWYLGQVEKEPVPGGDDQYELFNFRKYDPFLSWIDNLFAGTVKVPEMRNKTVVAAMYSTFTKNAQAAKEFWHLVARGGADDADETDPAKALDIWLNDIKLGKRDLAAAQIYQGCINAWNAYRDGRPIKDIRYAGKTWFVPSE
jgi:hypothetical protein